MSRTEKDAPYWVRVNREGTATRHDHRHLGEVRRRYRYVYNEDGSVKTEEVPVFKSAYEIVHGEVRPKLPFGRVRPEWSYTVRFPVSEAIFQKAREAVGSLRPDAPIQVGTEKRYVRVYEEYRLPDHCTEGEKLGVRENYWSSDLPCTPEIPRSTNHNREYTRGMSKARKGHRDWRNGKNRVTKLTVLRQEVQAWNSGEYVNEDNLEPLTDQHRHSMYWDLW